MSWYNYILAFLILSGILFPILVVPIVVYLKVFVRTGKSKWDGSCSEPNDLEQLQMYNEAIEWTEQNRSKCHDVAITNECFHLAGEYYDFGYSRTVLIIAGRTEGRRYSCYFAKPYQQSGFNVLVIDNRSHGESDGVFNSLGFREYRDILEWIRFLHDNYKQNSVYLHGVCIGSATALYALTAPECPDYVVGMTADGMYINFGESFTNHLTERQHRKFPTYHVTMFFVRLHAGRHPGKYGPINCIGRLTKPILFLHGKEDIYSIPKYAEQLYQTCGSPVKQLYWFEKGRHSCLRINAPERYDQCICDFLNVIENEVKCHEQVG